MLLWSTEPWINQTDQFCHTDGIISDDTLAIYYGDKIALQETLWDQGYAVMQELPRSQEETEMHYCHGPIGTT